jgi:hypothetical protein
MSPTNETDSQEVLEADSVEKSLDIAGVRTPCVLEGERVIAFVDSGATDSFVSADLVRSKGWKITPRSGFIQQCLSKKGVPRIGAIEDVIFENGDKRIKVDLEVADLAGEEEVIIGVDLFRSLGYTIAGVPFTWPENRAQDAAPKELNTAPKETDVAPKRIEYPEGVDENGIHSSWRQVLADNANIPVTSRCKLPGAAVSIDTGDAKPRWVRQYPIPQGRIAAVRQRLKEWDEKGWTVDAPPGCQWNILILAADTPSEDGGPPGIRVCLDARIINELLVTVIDSNLPGCHELLDHLGLFKWITKVDVADCYNQFEVLEEDRVKTAFTFDGRQRMFTVVPYGLRIMTGHVQRLLEKLLGKINQRPFQDDCGVASKSDESHVTEVREVLELLTYEAGLRLRLTKCKFFQVEVPLLGYLLTREGIKMDPRKVKAITNWERPVDGKAMQRFLGAVNYNREFSADFAKMSAPLEAYRLVRGAIEWTEERIEAFEKVKEIFRQEICLRHINWEQKIFLTTDASLMGIGVLSLPHVSTIVFCHFLNTSQKASFIL